MQIPGLLPVRRRVRGCRVSGVSLGLPTAEGLHGSPRAAARRVLGFSLIRHAVALKAAGRLR